MGYIGKNGQYYGFGDDRKKDSKTSHYLNYKESKSAECRIKLKQRLLSSFKSYISSRNSVIKQINVLYKLCKPSGINMLDYKLQEFLSSNIPAEKLYKYCIDKLEKELEEE